jgi:hypothetical protein
MLRMLRMLRILRMLRMLSSSLNCFRERWNTVYLPVSENVSYKCTTRNRAQANVCNFMEILGRPCIHTDSEATQTHSYIIMCIGGKAAGACGWKLTSMYCRGLECVEYYLHASCILFVTWCLDTVADLPSLAAWYFLGPADRAAAGCEQFTETESASGTIGFVVSRAEGKASCSLHS